VVLANMDSVSELTCYLLHPHYGGLVVALALLTI
jgi:hypothetical protein